MGDIALTIASTGLNAAAAAMDTISNNLSNVNTPGYLAETTDLVTNPSGLMLGIGGGVRVAGISQSGDWLLTANAQQTQGGLSQLSALQQVLQTTQSAFQEPSTTGLSAALSNFWQSWDSVAQNPSDPAARTDVLGAAQTVTSDLNSAAQQLSTIQADTTTQLSTTLTEANGLLSQVASLNRQIVTTQGAGESPNALIDQRNQVMNQLATDIGAVGQPQTDGTLQVMVGNSVVVSAGAWDSLSTTGSGPNEAVTATANGTTVDSPLTTGTISPGGQAAGLLTAINSYIPKYQAALDSVARDLASTVNTQLEQGYTASGTTGAANDLFTGTTAATIGVAITDPAGIAAATDPTAAANDGSNAQAMAELYNSATGPDQAYRTLVEQIGSDTQTTNNQVTTQTAVATAAQQNLQAVTGVNTDQQMVALINFQQAYQASAKVISTVDQAMQSLLAAV